MFFNNWKFSSLLCNRDLTELTKNLGGQYRKFNNNCGRYWELLKNEIRKCAIQIKFQRERAPRSR